MKPYYEHAGISIYHGDCREIVHALPVADLILADPPYGVSEQTNRKEKGRGTVAGSIDFPAVFGDDEPFQPAWLLDLKRPMVLWGANHFADRLPPSSSWLVWDKREGGTPDDNADCELAWSNLGGPARLFHHRWRGMIKASEKDQRRCHPTQKPVALMSWIIGKWTTPGQLVVDPYMGSGPTLRAAKDLGRRAIGIEIEERYCEVAVKRLAQETMFL